MLNNAEIVFPGDSLVDSIAQDDLDTLLRRNANTDTEVDPSRLLQAKNAFTESELKVDNSEIGSFDLKNLGFVPFKKDEKYQPLSLRRPRIQKDFVFGRDASFTDVDEGIAREKVVEGIYGFDHGFPFKYYPLKGVRSLVGGTSSELQSDTYHNVVFELYIENVVALGAFNGGPSYGNIPHAHESRYIDNPVLSKARFNVNSGQFTRNTYSNIGRFGDCKWILKSDWGAMLFVHDLSGKLDSLRPSNKPGYITTNGDNISEVGEIIVGSNQNIVLVIEGWIVPRAVPSTNVQSVSRSYNLKIATRDLSTQIIRQGKSAYVAGDIVVGWSSGVDQTRWPINFINVTTISSEFIISLSNKKEVRQIGSISANGRAISFS